MCSIYKKFNDYTKVIKLREINAAKRTAALPAAIAIFENRYFTFASLQQAANIFLMSKKHHQSHCNGKNPIEMFVLIKNDENKNGKCNTGKYRTQGNKPGEIKNQ